VLGLAAMLGCGGGGGGVGEGEGSTGEPSVSETAGVDSTTGAADDTDDPSTGGDTAGGSTDEDTGSPGECEPMVQPGRGVVITTHGGRSPVYRYHFSYDAYTTGPAMEPSAFHGLELVYVFGNFDAVSIGGFEYTPNADDLALSAHLGEAWTAFARTSDPSTDALTWPGYEVGVDPFAGLDVPPFAGEGVRTQQCDFWTSLLGG
jgi:hypothetical protein